MSKDLCASCGLCEVVCPEDLVTMQALRPKPSVPEPDRFCGTCNLCTDVCPGLHTGVSASEMALFGRARSRDERWLGIVRRPVLARSRDPEIYDRSSSGGCTTSLLLAAQQQFGLDYLVVAGRDPDRPWLASSSICRGKDDLLGLTQQSTYQLFAHLRILKKLYDEEPGATLAIVALPCQVQALRKLQRMDGPVAEYARSRIKVIVEIACSSNTLPEGTERLITDALGLPLAEVRDVRFRDGEYPGDFVVYLANGEKRRVELWKAVESFKKHKTHRCLSCGDWMSGLADLSICDGDPNIFMSSALPDARVAKHGRVLVRTPVGEQVVEHAIANGLLELMSGDVKRMNLGLERKRNRRAHYERASVPIPDSPITGYVEEGEPVSDERLLEISRRH